MEQIFLKKQDDRIIWSLTCTNQIINLSDVVGQSPTKNKRGGNMINMAVDVGFGRTKGIASTGERVCFESMIGNFVPVNFSTGLTKTNYRNIIQYKSRRYYVGAAAAKQSTANASIEKNRTISEEGIILLMAALGNLCQHTIETINLVVGLPILHYDLKNDYINAVIGKHEFEFLDPFGGLDKQRHITVKDIIVLPQPMGTYFKYAIDENGDLNKEFVQQKVGIADNGYNTFDLAYIDNMEYIEKKSTSISKLGMFAICQALQKGIYDTLGVEIPLEEIEQYIDKKEIKVKGEVKNIIDIKKRAFEVAAYNTISRMKSEWTDYELLDQIIISGGTSIHIGEYQKKALGKHAIIDSDPMWSNCEGYLRYAGKVWG